MKRCWASCLNLSIYKGIEEPVRAKQSGPVLRKEIEGKSMKCMNIIAVIDHTSRKMLMCRRRKNPYMGLYNLVGGKIEPGEESAHAAYRELREETGISEAEISLLHFCDFTYYTFDIRLEVWFGKLNAPFDVRGEENELHWMALQENFFDMTRFAGEGNIGHIVEELRAAGLIEG